MDSEKAMDNALALSLSSRLHALTSIGIGQDCQLGDVHGNKTICHASLNS